MKIGDLFFGILGDWGKFQADVVKEGDKAGKTLGESTSKGFNVGKVAVQGLGLAASGAFAMATKGAVQLEQVQANYQTATGASADEARAFAKTVNGMRASNTQSLEAIAAAGTQVSQQFKVTGDDAKTLTQDFLAFSAVTKQDAAGAVNDFDAALDAFGEPASRATGLMDQLVAGSQKYGTDAGPAAVKALADMAPALKAMGEGLDTGVGLLNLFEQSGIDAAAAPMALQRAIKTLKPGENIDTLIARLGAIEDPLLRGQKAMEIFGKGGVKMANAIQPGMTTLAEYKVSIAGVAGVTDKAADALVTSREKVRRFFEAFSAGLADVGQEFGPFLTGAASIGTLAGTGMASGFGKSLRTQLGPIVGGAFAGLKDTPAGAAGSKLGSAFSSGFKALAVVGVGLALGEIMDTVFRESNALAAHLVGRMSDAEATGLRAEMDAFAAENHRTFADIQAAVVAELDANGGTVQDAWKRFLDAKPAADLATAQLTGALDTQRMLFIQGERAVGADAATALASAQGIWQQAIHSTLIAPLLQAQPKAQAVALHFGRRVPQDIATGIHAERDFINSGMSELTDLLKNPLNRNAERMKLLGQLNSKELARGLHSGDPEIRARAQAIRDAIQTRLNGLAADARLAGIGVVDLLARGMSARLWKLRAVVNDVAAEVHRGLHQRSPAKVGPLSEDGGTEGWGRMAIEQMAGGVRSGIPALRSAVGQAGMAFATMPGMSMANIGATTSAARTGLMAASAGSPGGIGVTHVNVAVHSPFPLSPGEGAALGKLIAPHVWNELGRIGKVDDG